MRLTSRSAVRSFTSSALQPDFSILWKVSIFQRIAYQFSFSMASLRIDRQISNQLPVDRLAALRKIALGGMKNRKHQRRIHLLFRDRSKHPDAAIAEFKNRFAHAAFLIAHLDPVQPLHSYLAHLVGDGVVSFAREPVDTGPQKK